MEAVRRVTQEPEILRVPRERYLAIEGTSKPGGADFQARMRALFTVGYGLKFAEKKARRDLQLGMPGGMYWLDRPGTRSPARVARWKLLLPISRPVTASALSRLKAELAAKGKEGPIGEVRPESIAEGMSVQALHVGSYATETRTTDRMLAFARERGLTPSGPHHEIYINDPRRVGVRNLKTVLRYPVRKRATRRSA